jgi:Carboxypeptidase regulatory-like domain
MSAFVRVQLAVVLLSLLPMLERAALAQSAAVIGKVTSDREGLMEGVLVSAKRGGSTMTIAVVTDARGEYSFPTSRLEPGQYTLTTRAAGYVLESAPNVKGFSTSPDREVPGVWMDHSPSHVNEMRTRPHGAKT